MLLAVLVAILTLVGGVSSSLAVDNPLSGLRTSEAERQPRLVEEPAEEGDAIPFAPDTGVGEDTDPTLKLHEAPRGKPYERAFEGGFPKTAKDRAKVLGDLYAYLSAAPDAETAAEIAGIVERLWLISGSDTISVLMERSMKAVSDKQNEVALKLLDAVVDLAPDYAEGWNRRAFVHYLMDQRTQAAGDLRRVLALEPNHFKAMQGLAQILKDAGQKAGALKAYRQLRDMHPFAEGIEEAIRELSVDVEGQGI